MSVSLGRGFVCRAACCRRGVRHARHIHRAPAPCPPTLGVACATHVRTEVVDPLSSYGRALIRGAFDAAVDRAGFALKERGRRVPGGCRLVGGCPWLSGAPPGSGGPRASGAPGERSSDRHEIPLSARFELERDSGWLRASGNPFLPIWVGSGGFWVDRCGMTDHQASAVGTTSQPTGLGGRG